MGLAVGVVVGAVGIATIRSLLDSALGAVIWWRKLAVLKLIGILSLVSVVLSVSVSSTCMGAGVRSMWVGMASFA